METSQRSTGRTVAAVVLAVIAAICALAFVGSLGQSSDSGSMDVVPAILAVALGLWAASLWRGKK
jgi:Kef-type K+ transport system membrane component KefB